MATDKTNKTAVYVVLDKSGSMRTTQADTISGFNSYIEKLSADENGDYTVSLTQFDESDGPQLLLCYENKPVREVPLLTPQTYQPRGGTPLYDAIGECARRFKAEGRAVLFVVITDGQENASHEFSRDDVKRLIKRKEEDGWTFVFLGADIDSYAVGGSVGVNVGSTAQYRKGAENVMYANLAASTVSYTTSNATLGRMATANALRSNAINFFSEEQKLAMDSNPAGSSAAPSTFPVGKHNVDSTKSGSWNITNS